MESMTGSTASDASIPSPGPLRDLYDLVTGDEDARVCRDIPESACREQPRSFFAQLVAQALTKVGDGLADAKTVLAWLLAALGAPAAFVGLLVPLRESLSLLPQLVVAGFVRRAPVRKWFWVGGSVGQAAALVAMAVVAATMAGAAAGAAIVALLAVFSLSRGVCSVAAKDVLGKTISKARRGTLTGYATTVAGVAIVGTGLLLQMAREEDQGAGFFVALLLVAAGLWILAASVYTLVAEVPGETKGGGNAAAEAVRQLGVVLRDRRLLHFVLSRALLLGTALVGPFYVTLARESAGADLGGLGMMLVASGLAGAISASVWGRMADRSSRRVMAAGGGLAGLLGGIVILWLGLDLPGAESPLFFGGVIFVLGVAHAAVRIGRKTYLVDMAGAENRATYVAVSNTLIGVLLLAGGAVGLVAAAAGILAAVGLLSAMALAGAVSSWLQEEVE
jgi:hypothetical protein